MIQSDDEIISACISQFYDALRMADTKRRHKEQVKARNAIADALLGHFNSKQVAAHLSRDRSTLSHMVKKHEDNMSYWEGYKDRYLLAKEIVDSLTFKHVEETRLAYLAVRKQFIESHIRSIHRNIEIKSNQLNE